MKKALLTAVLSSLVFAGAQAQASEADVREVRDFIRNSWEKTFRFHTEDEPPLYGMPKTYTVPSISGAFQEMYYWDTFFIGEGLIRDGFVGQARNNVENMLHLVGRFGKMLNGNRVEFLNRSQPPFLSMMAEEVYRKTGDREWLRSILPGLEKEYDFWMSRRSTPIGLNRYGHEGTEADKESFARMLPERLGEGFRIDTLSPEQRLEVGSHYIAEAESGWDFNPRFRQRCLDFCPVDLNANLYRYEKNFAYFARELGDKQSAREWESRAERRKALIRKYMRDPQTGMYYDYDHVNGQRSDVVSAAVFSLLFAEAVAPKDARDIVRALGVLEFPHGVAACEDKPYGFGYQWSYPNGWAPLHYLVIRGLDNYGYRREARRIARKYVDMIVQNYRQTGNLWEKYNVVEGNVNVSNEYQMPTMIGWTAGIFVYATDYLGLYSR